VTARRPPWRAVLSAAAVFLAGAFAYAVWSPGVEITDGRHDRGRNALWLQHGWLGADEWFVRNDQRERLGEFRTRAHIAQLAALLRRNGITDLFPHVAPAGYDGRLPPVDHEQTERFLDGLAGLRVLPWTGGVVGKTCRPEDPHWRAAFVGSVAALLARHPRLAGIHVNLEPCPSGDRAFLALLDELRQALPAGKVLSVAAYPPPTLWHPFPEVHWEESYFREVARRVDQLAVMMYDTALPVAKPYRQLMRTWTREVLAWAEGADVLLGVPAYDDPGVGYHHPRVENLRNALAGIHAALHDLTPLPPHYQGVAIYCEWQMDESEWDDWRRHFLRAAAR
jgi:hypothetical protein